MKRYHTRHGSRELRISARLGRYSCNPFLKVWFLETREDLWGGSSAAALAGSRGAVLGRRNYLAPSLLTVLGACGEHFGHVRVPTA